MKVIFLDYDGVVNSLIFPDGSDNPTFNYPSDGKVNNHQAVQWLNKLCKHTGAKIVVTSTWRMFGHDIAESCLRNGGLKDNIEIVGYTPVLHVHRGQEIHQWIDNCGYNIDEFVILDDDSDMDDLMDHLVKCDAVLGFTYYEYEKAMKILGGSENEDDW